TVCVVGKIRDLILQLSKSSIYSTKPSKNYRIKKAASVLVELAKEYSSYNGCRRRQLIEVG
ncbi:hypothetical protein P4I53_21735, partial [Escherichia coli]